MKTLLILALTTLTFSAFAADKMSNVGTAKRVAIALVQAEHRYIENNLDLDIISVIEKDNIIKVELNLKTNAKTVKLHDCITFTFSDVKIGHVEKLENDYDPDSCEF
jgi:hypothetical protein